MAQLKMYWLAGTPITEVTIPEGYSVSNYKTEEDKLAWCECCRNGLIADDAGVEAFDGCITNNPNINLEEDVFFLDYAGEHVGTVTAFVMDGNVGDMHMVGIRTDHRGKGLAKILSYLTLKHLSEKGVKHIALTTDEWRVSAVKSYLTAGFRPVEYDLGMQDRWEAMLETLKVDSVEMLYDDATPYHTIYRKGLAKKIKIGVLGAGRGRTMMRYCVSAGNAELVAICDINEKLLREANEEYGQGKVACYTDFDEFLKHDMDCVVLANFANAHAPFAIRCLEAGKNVLSEVLPVQTMKEAVELIEAVERTGKIYAYAENYCYMGAPRKMYDLYRKGALGEFEYGEGEYMHNCEPGWHGLTGCSPKHWRNTMSAFYYCTHSLGPLVHIAGSRPVSVVGIEGPFNARMARMGAMAGAFGVEMVTLENGAVLKSLHGVGPSKNSVWYSIYGSKGRMESAREDAENGGTDKLYVNCDAGEGDNKSESVDTSTRDGLSDAADASGHGGSDYYVMHNLVEKLRGNRNAVIVDVYEAMDMFLPGYFALISAMKGGVTVEIPNLRDPAVRELWRNDTACTDPDVAGDMLLPSLSTGTPEIPDSTYEALKRYPYDKSITVDTRNELGIEL
ncbi:MAG: GNAT family N-acetyltransferase [Clostridia bacterium]|nr:GNAT family N-acetyltransferase [Clostridia bacterium]